MFSFRKRGNADTAHHADVESEHLPQPKPQRTQSSLWVLLFMIAVICLLIFASTHKQQPTSPTPILTPLHQQQQREEQQHQQISGIVDPITFNRARNLPRVLVKVEKPPPINLIVNDEEERPELEEQPRELEDRLRSLERQLRALKAQKKVLEQDTEALQLSRQLQEVCGQLLKSSPHTDITMLLEFPAVMLQPGESKFKELKIRMAPIELMPYAVYKFLQIIKHWKGGSFHRNAGHVLQAQVTDPLEGSLAFQEYNPSFPHEQFTMGFIRNFTVT